MTEDCVTKSMKQSKKGSVARVIGMYCYERFGKEERSHSEIRTLLLHSP